MKGCIAVAYHQPMPIYLDAAPFVPIAVGNAKDRLPNAFLRDDDTPANLAQCNDYYNELTALYRVWQDEALHADYMGLAHYARFLAPGQPHTYYYTSSWDKGIALAQKADYQSVFAQGAVAVVPYPAHQPVGAYYARFHDAEDIRRVLSIIGEFSPEYLSCAEAYFAQNNDYLCNLAVFAKPVFLRYCQWLFGVLQRYQQRYGLQERLYISERLTGVFISQLLLEGAVVVHAPIVQIAVKNKAQGRGCLRAVLKKIIPPCGWQCYYRGHFGVPTQGRLK